MKLFLSYSFTPEDQWIPDLVVPVLEDLGITVVTGRNIQGMIIVQQVPELIKASDALIAIFTRPWQEHPWVRDELIAALNFNIRALEVKETTLDPIRGLAEGRQRIDFDPAKREKLFVELHKVVCEWQNEWKKKTEMRILLLLPTEIAQNAIPHLNNPELRCTYTFLMAGEESPAYETKPIPLPAALGVRVRNIPSGTAYIRIVIQGPGFSYSSAYEDFSYFSVNLQKLPV